MPIKFLKLIISIGLCLGVGVVGSFFTIDAIPTWYATLNKPFFSPPNWVFGPVWTMLYFLMGISLFLVWTSANKLKKQALNLFFIQLAFNGLWSVVFFGLKSPLLAFVNILALLIAIVLTIMSFQKILKPAAYLLFPYIFWVGFASILNFFIVILN